MISPEGLQGMERLSAVGRHLYLCGLAMVKSARNIVIFFCALSSTYYNLDVNSAGLGALGLTSYELSSSLSVLR